MKKQILFILVWAFMLASTGCSYDADRYKAGSDNCRAEMKKASVCGIESADTDIACVNRLSDMLEKLEKLEKEATAIDEEKIEDVKKAGEWTYFRYTLEFAWQDEMIPYPTLFRYREDISGAERVTAGACYSYEVVADEVYYLDLFILTHDHGVLYVSEPGGGNSRILEEELFDFQVIGDTYIYYTYCYDTVGVGLEGHAVHRMNLDGSDKMIAAYEVSMADADVRGHFSYRVDDDGWVDCGVFRMELGAPADGCEKIVFKDIGDNEWIYYVTNRLMRARKDGSERTELDDVCDYHYEIVRIDGDWIYYLKGGMPYKIKTDGTEKESIDMLSVFS